MDFNRVESRRGGRKGAKYGDGRELGLGQYTNRRSAMLVYAYALHLADWCFASARFQFLSLFTLRLPLVRLIPCPNRALAESQPQCCRSTALIFPSKRSDRE